MISLAQNAAVVNAVSTELTPLVTGTGEVLIDVSGSGRVNPWSKHKAAALDLAQLYAEALTYDDSLISAARLADLQSCANWLEFAVDAEGHKRLNHAFFCRERHCPVCAWRRSLKMFAQSSKAVPIMQALVPTARFIFVTLTVKNVSVSPIAEVLEGNDSLSEALDALQAGCRLLTGSRIPKGAPPSLAAIRSALLGYQRCIEVTYNRERHEFHPHVHYVLAMKPEYFRGRGYVNQNKWQFLWKWIMRLDYEPVVHVRAVDLNKITLAEISKYPLKPLDFDAIPERRAAIATLINLKHACHARRFVTFGGIFAQARRVLKLDDVEDGDLVNLVDKPLECTNLAYYMFRYNVRAGVYIC